MDAVTLEIVHFIVFIIFGFCGYKAGYASRDHECSCKNGKDTDA